MTSTRLSDSNVVLSMHLDHLLSTLNPQFALMTPSKKLSHGLRDRKSILLYPLMSFAVLHLIKLSGV
jgi:hypothetical protein